MILKSHIAKRVVALLTEVIDGLGDCEWTREMVALRAHFRGRRPPSKKLPTSLQSRKPSKQLAYKAQTKEIRAAVMERAAGVCEFCGQSNHPCRASEMHHLEGGSGRRRQQQAISNCVAICRLCHRGYHANPELYRNLVVRWSGRYGYPVPSRFRGRATGAPREMP